MKKIFFAIGLSLATVAVNAQSVFDAYRYNQNDINGTARFMSMAGAFTALGGDASAIHLNPAGVGVYRSSEFSITSGVLNNVVNTNYSDQTAKDNKYKVPLNNMSYVINFGGDKDKKHGLVNSSFGISFNKLKNFNRNIYMRGDFQSPSMTDKFADFAQGNTMYDMTSDSVYDPMYNENIPWIAILGYEAGLIDTVGVDDAWETVLFDNYSVRPSYALSETGYINEWAFSYGANISNKLFLGAALGIQDVEYSMTSVYAEEFSLNQDGFLLTNSYYAYGTGVNLKLGTIIRPVNFLRIGLSMTTPTILAMTEEFSAKITSTLDGYTISSNTPYLDGGNYYKVQGPMLMNVGAAVVLGKKGLISAEYNLANYTSMKFKDKNGTSINYTAENQEMQSYLLDSHTLKLGAELKLTDNFAVRAGYAITTAGTDSTDARKVMPYNTIRTDLEYFTDIQTSYYSGGIGYREDNWFFDLTYMLKTYDQNYYPYNLPDAKSATVKTRMNNFVATLGYKF